MAERRCPFCGEPADPGHAGCAGLFRDVMRAAPTPPPEDLPAEVAPHAADPARLVRHYVLVEIVGRGGMGVVWKAWDRRLARWVAVKFLHGGLAGDAARFEREARLAAKLTHPNIASVLELGEVPSPTPGEAPQRFLAMAFVDGPPLSAAPLPPREAAAVFAKVARAVDAAHRSGILHRDLKPQNILLSREGWPYVTDFGLARTIDAPGSLTASGAVLGTPAYMSPEQAEGRPADVRSDVYALGASLYAVLCGRAPFEAESALAILSMVQRVEPPPPRRLKPGIPAPLEDVVLRAMRKAPEQRHPSAAALAENLEGFLAGRPAGSPPSKAPLVAAVLLLLAAAGAAAWHFRPSPAPPPPPLLRPAVEAPPPAEPATPAPADPPALESIDLAACLRSADPEAELGRVERELAALWAPDRLSKNGRRKLLSAMVAAGAQRLLLAGRTEAEAARELASWGDPLREAGGPSDPEAFGPRVARVFEALAR